MSPLVKTKRQVNFKDFKRFGAFKGLVEQKNVVFNSFLCKLGFSGTPIYTRTRQINYCSAFGYLKNKLYKRQMNNLNELIEESTNCCRKINEQMSQNIFENRKVRVRCLEQNVIVTFF
jgi:hypothetical protein